MVGIAGAHSEHPLPALVVAPGAPCRPKSTPRRLPCVPFCYNIFPMSHVSFCGQLLCLAIGHHLDSIRTALDQLLLTFCYVLPTLG